MTMPRILRAPARRISHASRRRKLRILTNWIEPGSTVLLVGASAVPGVGTQSLVERGLAEHANVVALTYEPVDGPILGMPTVRGDGRDLPFADKSFDYVISNAVIEHVGGPEGARAMLVESERVARIGWAHTTPNRRFPIELHLGVPVLHWLPEKLRERAFAAIGQRYTRDLYYLFSSRSLRRLSPRGAVVKRATGLVPALTLFVASASFRTK